MTSQQIAKTIVDTLFAAKIVNALKLKQTIKQTGNIETINEFRLNALTIIDTDNNTIIKLRYETHMVNINHNVTVKLPKLNYTNLEKLTEYIVGLPIIEKLNQAITDFKHISVKTIKNTYHVIDAKTKELIAVLKFTIPSVTKQLVNKIISLVKKFYTSITKNKLPFVIGLLGGFILSPFANKILSVFNYAKKESAKLYLESDIIDAMKTVFTNITQKLFAIVTNVYTKFASIIKTIVLFIGGLLLGLKDTVEDAIQQFIKIYNDMKPKISEFMVYVTIKVLRTVHLGLYVTGNFIHKLSKIIELASLYLTDLRKNINDYVRYLQIHKTELRKIYPVLAELDNLLLQNQKRLDEYLAKIDEVFSVDELLYHGYYSDQVIQIIEDFADTIRQDLDMIIQSIEISIERLDKIDSEELKKTARNNLAVLIDKLRSIIADYLAILRYVDSGALSTYEKRFREMIISLREKYYKTSLLGALIRTYELIKDIQKQPIDKL